LPSGPATIPTEPVGGIGNGNNVMDGSGAGKWKSPGKGTLGPPSGCGRGSPGASTRGPTGSDRFAGRVVVVVGFDRLVVVGRAGTAVVPRVAVVIGAGFAGASVDAGWGAVVVLAGPAVTVESPVAGKAGETSPESLLAADCDGGDADAKAWVRAAISATRTQTVMTPETPRTE
jgi:hypothetical protein